MKFLRVFATKKEWRAVMNGLIGKYVEFKKPIKDYRNEIYDYTIKTGQIADFTDDLLNVLVVENITGELFKVPIDSVKVLDGTKE